MTRQHTTPWIGGVLAFGLMLVFGALGHWQLERRQSKQVLLDTQIRALTLPARDLATALADDTRVQQVSDCGHWRGQPLLLDSQQRDGRTGHITYQPFETDNGAWVLVELGWRAWSLHRTLPPTPVMSGAMCLRGLLLPAPSPGLALGRPVLQVLPDGGWLADRLTVETLAQLPPVFSVLSAQRVWRPDPGLRLGYAREASLLPNTLPPERHLGYAVQWFGLAAAVAIGALLLWGRAYMDRRVGRAPTGDADARR